MSAPENPSFHPLNPTNDATPGAFFPEPGITLRDHFAGIALPSSIEGLFETGFTGEGFSEAAARLAYQMADAMLAVRQEEPR